MLFDIARLDVELEPIPVVDGYFRISVMLLP